MRIIDTYDDILSLFQNSKHHFNKELWQIYVNKISIELSAMCLKDSSSYDFQKDVLPVLEHAMNSGERLEKLHNSFVHATDGLNRRIIETFDTELEVDIILYFGLCNGAGWVTELDNKIVILLGVEKIIELGWCDTKSLIALIYHELGHVLHETFGTLFFDAKTTAEKSLWQLYQEGVAMYYEQALLSDFTHYHQNKNGWLSWCCENKTGLFHEYKRRVDSGESTQDFFGDWCSYKGDSDVGYYLGCELVKALSKKVHDRGTCKP